MAYESVNGRGMTTEQLNALGGHNMSSGLAAASTTSMAETMRSFKDSLSFSFQNLNLTLATLQNSITNLSTKVGSTGLGGTFNSGLPTNYITSRPSGTYLGATPSTYASLSANTPFTNMDTATVPGNIGGLQFNYNYQAERPYRMSNNIMAYGGAAAIQAADLIGGKLIGGMLGGGMLGGAGGMLMGSVPGAIAAAVIKPLVEDAIVHNKDVFNIQRMSNRFGDKFSTTQAQTATRGIENLAYRELMNQSAFDPQLGMSGMRDITMTGLQANLFHGSSPEELVKQVESASKVVKFLMTTMGNKDIQDTMQMVKQMKDMGVNLFEQGNLASTLGKNAFKYGNVMGVNPNELMSQAANISASAFGARGNAAFVGVDMAMKNSALLSEMEKRKMLTPAEIASAGGLQAMNARAMNFQAGMLNSGAGMAMLYSGYKNGGKFDASAFKRAAAGGFWDTVGQAGANFFSDSATMADMLVNKENIIADAANNGTLQQAIELQAKAIIDNSPQVQNARTRQEKINYAALTIRDIALNFGTEMTLADAKAMAMRILQPELAKRLEFNADREYTKARMGDLKQRSGLVGLSASVGRAFDRVKGTLYEKFNLRGVADDITKAVEDKSLNTNLGSDFAYADALKVYNVASTMQEQNKLAGFDSSYSDRLDYATARDAADKVDTLGLDILGNLGAANPFSTVRNTEASFKNNQEAFYAKALKGMQTADSSTAMQKARASGLIGRQDDININDIVKDVEKNTGIFGNNDLNSVLQGTAKSIVELNGGRDSMLSVARKNMELKGNSLTEDQLRRIREVTDTRNGSYFKDGKITSALDQSAFEKSLKGKSALEVVDKIAAELGTTREQVIGSASIQLGGNLASNEALINASGQADAYQGIVSAVGKKLGVDGSKVGTAADLLNGRVLRGRETLGLTADFLGKAAQGKNSDKLQQDLVTYSNFVNKVANGGKITDEDLKDIQSPEMRKLVQSKLIDNLDINQIKSAQRDLSDVGMFSKADSKKVTANLTSGSTTALLASAGSQIRTGLAAVGVQDIDESLYSKLYSGTLSSDDANDVLAKFRKAGESGSAIVEEALARAQEKLGKTSGADVTKLAAQYSVNMASSSGTQLESQNKQNELKSNSKIDSTVDTYKGKNVVLVVDATEENNLATIEEAKNLRNQSFVNNVVNQQQKQPTKQ